MSGFRKVGTPLIAVLSVCLLLSGGCETGDSGSPQDDQSAQISSGQMRNELLRELDNKFENPAAHFALGQLYHSEGRWAQAGYHYDIALSFDPVNRPAQAAMVKVLQDSGDAAAAQERVEKYMKQAEVSGQESLRLGKAFGRQQLETYALACYQQALRLSPDSAPVFKEVGYYYLNKGDKALAREYLSRSYRIDPTQTLVAEELGRLGIEVRVPKEPVKSTEEPQGSAEQPGNPTQ